MKKLLKEKTLTDVDNDSDMADVDNETVIWRIFTMTDSDMTDVYNDRQWYDGCLQWQTVIW